MELSPNQEKIVSVLSDNQDGLGFNDLKRKTELHSKVLQDNLKKLVADGVVTKNKAGVNRWDKSNYKLTIDPDFLKVIERSFAEIEDFEKKWSAVTSYPGGDPCKDSDRNQARNCRTVRIKK